MLPTTDQGDPEAERFGAWLATQMRQRRMSRRRVAELTGLDVSTITRLLRSQRCPRVTTAARLAAAFGASAPYLGPERRCRPEARIEFALLEDEALAPRDVVAVMGFYRAQRARSA